MFRLICKSLKRNLLIYLYIFFQMILVSTAIIFSVSIYMDVYNKLSKNKYVMDTNTYSLLGKKLWASGEKLDELENLDNEIKEKKLQIPYYKNIEKNVLKKTGRELDALFLINEEFLNIRNFTVSEGEDLKSTKEEVPILIGNDITEFNIGDEIEINKFGQIITEQKGYGDIDESPIKAKIVGRLSKENMFWITEFTVPLSLDNSIIMFDNEKIELTIATNYFVDEEHEDFGTFKNIITSNFGVDSGEVFLKIKSQLINMLIAKDSPAYIIAVFMMVLTVIAINCIGINVCINFYKRLKEFGIRMAMGFNNSDILKMVIGEYYIISIIAYILSCFIGKVLQDIVPVKLGYTFDSTVILVSFILVILYMFPILYSVYRRVKKLTPSKLIRENL